LAAQSSVEEIMLIEIAEIAESSSISTMKAGAHN